MDQIMYQPAIGFPGEARRIVSVGTIDLIIPWQATNGQMSVWVSIVAPGEGPPMHIHRVEDEMFHVLSGTFRFWCGDEVFEGGPGTTAILPRGIPHTFQNIGSAEGRFLGTATPGGFEEFFIELEGEKITDPAGIARVGEKYGLSFVPPKAASANAA